MHSIDLMIYQFDDLKIKASSNHQIGTLFN